MEPTAYGPHLFDAVIKNRGYIMLFASFYMPIQCNIIDWVFMEGRETLQAAHPYPLRLHAWTPQRDLSTNFHSPSGTPTEQKCGSSPAASSYFWSDLFRDVEPRNSDLVAVRCILYRRNGMQ